MREIEFRGKAISNGQWVYGSLLIENNRYYIGNYTHCISGDKIINNIRTQGKTTNRYKMFGLVEVDPETVGQYTGKLNCKANKIFEKDIVKGIRRTNQYEEYEYFEVKFHNGCFMAGNFNMHEFFDKFSHKEVIGNIYDNQELLEKED